MKTWYIVAVLIVVALAVTVSKLPRGIRNNNPGNIRKGSSQWVGKVNGFDSSFETFDTAENGIRALAVLLKKYMQTGTRTVRTIIKKYAPSTENDTEAYVIQVSRAVGLPPDRPLDESHIKSLVLAIIRHENGQQPYTMAQIDEAIDRA